MDLPLTSSGTATTLTTQDDGRTLIKDFNSNSAISDSYTTTPADQGKFIGCTVTYLDVTVSESARSEVSTSPLPLATMKVCGLISRKEYDYGNRAGEVNAGDFTFSTWVKPTDYNPAQGSGYIATFSTSLTDSDKVGVKWNGDGFHIYANGDSQKLAATVNKWYHLHLTYDGTTLTLTMDGSNTVSEAYTKNNYALLAAGWLWRKPHQ